MHLHIFDNVIPEDYLVNGVELGNIFCCDVDENQLKQGVRSFFPAIFSGNTTPKDHPDKQRQYVNLGVPVEQRTKVGLHIKHYPRFRVRTIWPAEWSSVKRNERNQSSWITW